MLKLCSHQTLFVCVNKVLYRSGPGGEPVEDETYGPFPGNTKRYLDPKVLPHEKLAPWHGLYLDPTPKVAVL